MKYEKLAKIDDLGVELVNNYLSQSELEIIMAEINSSDLIDWYDAHETYVNNRGLTIVQNHDTFALKLSDGDQSYLNQLPQIKALKNRTQQFIRNMSDIFPALTNWQADEVCLHLYDDQAVGLSRHRDNLRFTGMIAIIALDGEADLVISHQDQEVILPTVPGDLCLLRAPGLFETNQEIRPEHSVQNLKTPQRMSMMIRANDKPTQQLPGFKFNNWPR